MDMPGLRERTKRAMRAEIATTAITLFLAHGFEATTIHDVVAATGVSRRTFFRYFATKEDVVLGYLADLGDQLCAALAARPPEEPVWEALRRAMDDAKRVFVADPDRMIPIVRLCDDAPSLRGRHHEKVARWRAGLTVELAARLDVDPERDLRPAVYAMAAVGALDVVAAAWTGPRKG